MHRIDRTTTVPRSPGRTLAAAMLVLFVAWSFSAGVVGGYLMRQGDPGWYDGLAKPSFNPPGWVFAPVWSVLYLLMGVSAWLIWRSSVGSARRRALLLFVVQLALNGIWSFLFFGLRSPGWAAPEIVLLWCAIVATLLAFAKINRLAAGLLAPYLLWVSFAVALNLAIWNLNR